MACSGCKERAKLITQAVADYRDGKLDIDGFKQLVQQLGATISSDVKLTTWLTAQRKPASDKEVS